MPSNSQESCSPKSNSSSYDSSSPKSTSSTSRVLKRTTRAQLALNSVSPASPPKATIQSERCRIRDILIKDIKLIKINVHSNNKLLYKKTATVEEIKEAVEKDHVRYSEKDKLLQKTIEEALALNMIKERFPITWIKGQKQ